MPMPTNPNIIDIKNMTETDRFLIVYQGWRDTYTELDNHIKAENVDRSDMKSDLQTLNKLVITGNGQPSVMEQLRNHQKFIDGVFKLVWMFIGAVVVQIVAFIGIAIWAVTQLSQLIK